MIPEIRGLHLEPTNICTLKCPGCARTRFIGQWPQHWNNHSLERSTLMSFLDIDLSGVKISMCGNYGDPIYHPDLAGMVRDLKQRGATISITTNGGHRKMSWWNELTKELSSEDDITFSIDGIPENFTQYRINGDWKTTCDAIKICVSAECNTTWKFIPFSFNENNIEQARQLSRDLGVDQFQVSLSERFDDITMVFKPNDKYIGEKWNSQQNWKQSKTIPTVVPECQSGESHFISADGHYMPCCYIGDHRFYYKTEFGKNKKQYNINDSTLSEILVGTKLTKFYDNLSEQSACQFNCGK
jgi:MoaA/NifB/PqqE/SkfB family radical SAM enzyme